MKEIWQVVDRRTKHPVTVSAFFSEASAQRQIDAWRARRLAGERPDVTDEMLDNLVERG